MSVVRLIETKPLPIGLLQDAARRLWDELSKAHPVGSAGGMPMCDQAFASAAEVAKLGQEALPALFKNGPAEQYDLLADLKGIERLGRPIPHTEGEIEAAKLFLNALTRDLAH
jgi:hypothetical protein